MSSSSSSFQITDCCKDLWTQLPINGSYVDIAISENGKNQYALDRNRLFKSIDFGNSWQVINNSNWQNFIFNAISISKSSRYIFLAPQNQKLQYSIDSGINWLQLNNSPLTTWKSIDISEDAKYIGAVDGSFIYKSFNSGVDWSVDVSNVGQFDSISIADNGSFWTVVGNNSTISVSNDFGQSWRQKAFVNNWNKVKLSANGQYQIVSTHNGSIYTSQDFGNAWAINYVNIEKCQGVNEDSAANDYLCCIKPWEKSISDAKDWIDIAISYQGQFQIAVSKNYKIYISRNKGVNWSLVSSCYNVDWSSVDISYNGQIMIASSRNGALQISKDYGNTWESFSENLVPIRSWEKVAISYNSEYILLVSSSGGFNNNGSIYLSKNYGNTWNVINLRPTENNGVWKWYDASMSADGRVQSVIGENLRVYLSQDYGNTWESKLFPSNWNKIDISNNGQYQIITQISGNLYTSADYGTNWNPNYFNLVRCSSGNNDGEPFDPGVSSSTSFTSSSSTSLSSSSSSLIICTNNDNCPPQHFCSGGFCVPIFTMPREIRVKNANFFFETNNYFTKFFGNITGYGNMQEMVIGTGSGIINNPTGWQPALIQSTGRLTGIANISDLGKYTWNNLNLTKTINSGPVYLQIETGYIPATNAITFLNTTGSGLQIGDRININNINFYYSPNPQGLFQFSSPEHFVNILNSGYNRLLNDNDLIYSSIGVTASFSNRFITLYSLRFSGEEGNKIRLYKESSNPNAIRVLSRYFQNGRTLRRTTSTFTNNFSFSGNLTIENSGFYTQKINDDITGNIRDIRWIDSFSNWSVKTGLFMQGNSNFFTQNVGSGLNNLSGNGLIRSGNNFRYTGLSVEISKLANYNLENNLVGYIIYGNNFIYSGTLKG